MAAQVGSKVAVPTFLSTTMGMLVTGSIINPRIFISTSICPPLSNHLPNQAVGETLGYLHVNIPTGLWRGFFSAGKVQRDVLRGAADDLSASLVETFNHYFIDASYALLVVHPLDFPLPLLQNVQTLGLFFVGNAVDHAE